MLKKVFILVSSLFMAQAAQAFSFANAITLCSPPNNPMVNALMAVGGNTFGAIESRQEGNDTVFTGELIDDPGACNAAIMASMAPKGSFTLRMGYQVSDVRPDRPLHCKLTVETYDHVGEIQPRESTFCSN